LLQEVRNATGYGRVTRTADAVALGLWPSRGLELYGFEIKVSRSDLRKELDDPAKAEEIMQYCDRWYLVLGHEELIQPGELPSTWGLMVAQKNRLVVKVEAPKLKAKPLDRKFICSVLRNYTECYVPRAMLNSMVQEKYKEWEADEEKRMDREDRGATEDLRNLKEVISEFEEASGVNVRRRWMAGRIGKAVNLLMESDFGQARTRLEQLAISAQHVVDQAKRELEVIDKVKGASGDCRNRRD